MKKEFRFLSSCLVGLLALSLVAAPTVTLAEDSGSDPAVQAAINAVVNQVNALGQSGLEGEALVEAYLGALQGVLEANPDSYAAAINAAAIAAAGGGSAIGASFTFLTLNLVTGFDDAIVEAAVDAAGQGTGVAINGALAQARGPGTGEFSTGATGGANNQAGDTTSSNNGLAADVIQAVLDGALEQFRANQPSGSSASDPVFS